ncbi:MAG: hypothetical protein MZV70_02855 [Desulfobacterales bacterium]|nr:hypothetical protein [Desulfobacterales bacterium]
MCHVDVKKLILRADGSTSQRVHGALSQLRPAPWPHRQPERLQQIRLLDVRPGAQPLGLPHLDRLRVAAGDDQSSGPAAAPGCGGRSPARRSPGP